MHKNGGYFSNLVKYIFKYLRNAYLYIFKSWCLKVKTKEDKILAIKIQCLKNKVKNKWNFILGVEMAILWIRFLFCVENVVN